MLVAGSEGLSVGQLGKVNSSAEVGGGAGASPKHVRGQAAHRPNGMWRLVCAVFDGREEVRYRGERERLVGAGLIHAIMAGVALKLIME